MKEFTDATFQTEVLGSDKLVLVDFWAPWCGPCKVLGPIIEEVAGEAEGAVVGKMNVDENQVTAGQYGIMSIPTMIIFKDGQPVDQIVGVKQKAEILAAIEKHN